jgi:hypothetical protein
MNMQAGTFSLDERTAISRAFAAGNYANAYETTTIDNFALGDYSEHERAAFVLGFFAAYTLSEIDGDREIYDECYFSAAGQYLVNDARCCDSRQDEYEIESEEEGGL